MVLLVFLRCWLCYLRRVFGLFIVGCLLVCFDCFDCLPADLFGYCWLLCLLWCWLLAWVWCLMWFVALACRFVVLLCVFWLVVLLLFRVDELLVFVVWLFIVVSAFVCGLLFCLFGRFCVYLWWISLYVIVCVCVVGFYLVCLFGYLSFVCVSCCLHCILFFVLVCVWFGFVMVI